MRGFGPRNGKVRWSTSKARAYGRSHVREGLPAPTTRSKYTPGQQGEAERARRLGLPKGGPR